jgi:HD domain
MDLSKELTVAENHFREKLEVYFNGIFRDIRLESHGLDHHRRVWMNARDLLMYREISSVINDHSFPLKVLIGSFLHDSGMAVDRGPKHGEHSRKFCEEFIILNGLQTTEFTDLLEAVENHDKKNYTSAESKSMLLNILTVADDLDALGFTGIYRYIEIYLMRGKKFAELGHLIIANVNGRFTNLEETFGHIHSLTARFRPGLEVITGFFEKYNIRAKGYSFGAGNPEGYCGVAEIIGSMIKNEMSLEDIIDSSVENPDRVISWFFGELKKEIS